jgi:hypothetical protein
MGNIPTIEVFRAGARAVINAEDAPAMAAQGWLPKGGTEAPPAAPGGPEAPVAVNDAPAATAAPAARRGRPPKA